MATMYDIAQKTGVSKSTVSRTLRHDPTLHITEETRRKILSTAEELGYKIKKEKMLSYVANIAIIHKDTHFLNQIDNAFFFAMRYGIEQTCLLNNIQNTFIPYEFLNRTPMNYDGFIIIGGFTRQQMEKMRDIAGGKPCVYVGKCNYCYHEFDWITSDVKENVYTAMGALYEAGCRKVLYMGGIDVEGTDYEFKKTYYYRKFLEQHSDMKSIDLLEGEHGSESGYNMMKKWIEDNNELPEGIFASNDPIAIGAIRALNEKEISIPGEVSIVSRNGDEQGAMTSPPLATVDVHPMEMGKEAVKLISERLEERSGVRKKIMFASTYIPRKSVR